MLDLRNVLELINHTFNDSSLSQQDPIGQGHGQTVLGVGFEHGDQLDTKWVWSYWKVADLANIACDLLPELDALLQKAKKRLRRKPDLIQAFIRDAGYDV